MVDLVVRGKPPAGLGGKRMEALVGTVLGLTGTDGDVALAVSVVGERRIRTLNREHRGKDTVTDVLSFGFDEGEGDYDLSPKGELVRQLGDIVICLPQVKRQAKRNSRTIRAEFALMVVHGTLHLLGYDHATPAQEREMFPLQHEALLQAGIL